MKLLYAMLFHNITIGSTVMFREDKEKMEKAWKDGTFYKDRQEHINNQLTVVDIYSTLFWKDCMFKPKGIFRIGATLTNGTGPIQHVGIGAVKPIMVTNL